MTFLLRRWRLRHLIYFRSNNSMTEDIRTRESSYCDESERQIYYYSKFDLFGGQNEQEFYQFSIFGDRVEAELGADWATEAGLLYYPFLSSRQVFLHLLQLWLKHHPFINSMRSHASTFSPHFVADFDSLVRSASGKIPEGATVKPAQSSLRAVCLGFYMTANEVWEQLFKSAPEKQNNPFSAGFLKGVTSTLEKTFKPLMVVRQRISNVFGHKRRKLNEDQPEEENEDRYGECYQEFRRAMDIEKQLERKLSDFELDDLELHSQRKEVERKTFAAEEGPLQPSLVSSVYSYVTGFLHRNPSWQIASNFVTQILELNQVQLQEGKKVKVMRPAQDFYRKLLMAWLLFLQGPSNGSFQEYLTLLRSTFLADSWQGRFTLPTRYFFERMRGDWEEIKREGGKMTDQKVLSTFLTRIKGSVNDDWNHKIAMKQ